MHPFCALKIWLGNTYSVKSYLQLGTPKQSPPPPNPFLVGQSYSCTHSHVALHSFLSHSSGLMVSLGTGMGMYIPETLNPETLYLRRERVGQVKLKGVLIDRMIEYSPHSGAARNLRTRSTLVD